MINQLAIFKLLVAPAPALSASVSPHISVPPILEFTSSISSHSAAMVEGRT